VGEVANGIPTSTVPLSLSLSRKGRGDFFCLLHFSHQTMLGMPGDFLQTRFVPLPGWTCQGEPDDRVMDRKVPPKNSHWHAAEHRRGCRKGDLHCLRRSRVCKAPAASRSAGHPAFGGTRDTGALFLFLLSGTQKKKEGTTKKGGRSSPLPPISCAFYFFLHPEGISFV
jgi:hypothetical protein